MMRQIKVSPHTPEAAHVALADHRLDGFIEAWATSMDKDIRVLVRSAYLQGLNDMADAAARMQAAPILVEIEAQGLEGL